jgi:tetratricopeptide (TPR) repeat protein
MLLVRGRDQAAIAALGDALERNPAQRRANYLIGRSLLAANQPGAALERFLREWELSRDADVPLAAGIALIRLGRHAESLGWLETALASAPEEEQAAILYQQGLAYEGLDRRGEALACYRRAVAEDPDHEPARAAVERLTTDPAAEGIPFAAPDTAGDARDGAHADERRAPSRSF